MSRPDLEKLEKILCKHEDESDAYVDNVYCNSEIKCPTCKNPIRNDVFTMDIENEAIHRHYTCHRCNEVFELTYILSSMFKQSDGGLN